MIKAELTSSVIMAFKDLRLKSTVGWRGIGKD